MILRVNIISKHSKRKWKRSGARGGAFWATQQGLNSVGSKEHLDWLKINLNGWNNYCSRLYAHKKLTWMEVHIHSVKAGDHTGNVQVKYIMTTQKGHSGKKISYGS